MRSATRKAEGKLVEPDSAEEEEAGDPDSTSGGEEVEEVVPDIPIPGTPAPDPYRDTDNPPTKNQPQTTLLTSPPP